MQLRIRALRSRGCRRSFNPHPARRPGATSGVFLDPPRIAPVVSILTRPEGRVQRAQLWPSPGRSDLVFQSSPGQKAGCNPARRPGATADAKSKSGDPTLFQSSPGQKAGCNAVVPIDAPFVLKVSILTRPEGRVQGRAPVFQSSPGQKAGCNSQLRRSFNPHPARRPGATCSTCVPSFSFNLTRPEGRVQLPHPSRSRSACTFQSSPGQKAGCNERNSGRQPFRCFNHPASSPGQKAGCNRRRKIEVVSILTRPEGRVQRRAHRRTIRPQSFNHPARRSGATLNFSNATVNSGVSILTRPEGRVQQPRRRRAIPRACVSILTRPEGRVQPSKPTILQLDHTFQSSPGQKAGCNHSCALLK